MLIETFRVGDTRYYAVDRRAAETAVMVFDGTGGFYGAWQCAQSFKDALRAGKGSCISTVERIDLQTR